MVARRADVYKASLEGLVGSGMYGAPPSPCLGYTALWIFRRSFRFAAPSPSLRMKKWICMLIVRSPECEYVYKGNDLPMIPSPL